jgi:hypothetical protein
MIHNHSKDFQGLSDADGYKHQCRPSIAGQRIKQQSVTDWFNKKDAVFEI